MSAGAAPRVHGEVLFGVAGWAYDDWKGVVYPRGCKDTLRAVASRVDLIEVNTTFYGLPSAKNSTSWVERTADLGTRFTAKLPAEVTHERRVEPATVAAIRDGFAPLWASGRMLGLLAQFPHGFAATPHAHELLERIAATFAVDGPLFVELRHRSWNDDAALQRAEALGLGVLALDYPGAASGFARDVPRAVADGTAYFRLHGRSPAWFERGAGRDRVYDWRYSADEVAGIAQRVERLAAGARRTLVVANNHFRGSAMVVAEELLAWYRGVPP
jgi:uncharacterized protein YecE (DUF72 family)